MTRFLSAASRTGSIALAVILISGCARIESFVTGDPTEKEYKAATKLPPLEIPPEISRVPVTGGNALTIPGVDEEEIAYSARHGAVSTGRSRNVEAVSFLQRDERGAPTLTISGGFSTAWNEVNGALGKLGIKIVGRNRERGILRVEVPVVGEVDRSVVDRLTFWNNDETPLAVMQMVVENLGEPTTLVRIFDGNDLDSSATANDLLDRIHRQLSPETTASKAATAGAAVSRFESQSVPEAVATVADSGRRYRLDRSASAPRILSAQEFPRAWREVGLALESAQITVEDRDRSRGIYFVEQRLAPQQRSGMFSRLKFWGDDEGELIKQLVVIQPLERGGSQVMIFDEDEKLSAAAAAVDLLEQIQQQLP